MKAKKPPPAADVPEFMRKYLGAGLEKIRPEDIYPYQLSDDERQEALETGASYRKIILEQIVKAIVQAYPPEGGSTTGAGYASRELYTDLDLVVIAVARPFIINGIGDFVTRPDLIERAIPLQLSVPAARRTEDELRAELEAALPEILGGLYEAAAWALRHHDETPPPEGVRMIDAARWITAAEPGLGIEGGAFVQALRQAQEDIVSERMNNEPLTILLEKFLTSSGPFAGLVSDLFGQVCAGETERGLPQTPAQLSKMIKRLGPGLSTAGINVRLAARTKKGRVIRVWLEGQKEPASLPPYMTAQTKAAESGR